MILPQLRYVAQALVTLACLIITLRAEAMQQSSSDIITLSQLPLELVFIIACDMGVEDRIALEGTCKYWAKLLQSFKLSTSKGGRGLIFPLDRVAEIATTPGTTIFWLFENNIYVAQKGPRMVFMIDGQRFEITKQINLRHHNSLPTHCPEHKIQSEMANQNESWQHFIELDSKKMQIIFADEKRLFAVERGETFLKDFFVFDPSSNELRSLLSLSAFLDRGAEKLSFIIGSYCFEAEQTGSALKVLDLDTQLEIQSLEVGLGPHIFFQNRQYLYILNCPSGILCVIDVREFLAATLAI